MLLKRGGQTWKRRKQGVDLLKPSLLEAGISGAFQSAGTGARAAPFWVIIDPISWYMSGAPSAVAGQTQVVKLFLRLVVFGNQGGARS